MVAILAVVGTVLAVNRYSPKHLPACPTTAIGEQGWQTVPLPYGPLAVQIPPGARRDPTHPGWNGVSGSEWSLGVDVVSVPADAARHIPEDAPLDFVAHLLADEPYLPIPSGLATIGARYCTDTTADRPMRLRLFHTRMYSGPYMADAAWPMARGSWLVVGIAGRSAAARDTALAVLRSLHADTSAATLSSVHPHLTCPAWPEPSPSEFTQRLHVGSVAFTTPASVKQLQGYAFTAAWELADGGGLRFRIIRAPGWQLPPVVDDSPGLPRGVWLWCRADIHGRLAEFLVDTTARSPDNPFAQGYDVQAFMALAQDSVLEITALTGLTRSDAAARRSIREILQVLRTAQVPGAP